jgi:hypothetical protein
MPPWGTPQRPEPRGRYQVGVGYRYRRPLQRYEFLLMTIVASEYLKANGMGKGRDCSPEAERCPLTVRPITHDRAL